MKFDPLAGSGLKKTGAGPMVQIGFPWDRVYTKHEVDAKIGAIAVGGAGVSSVNGRSGVVTLSSSDVGLGSVQDVDTTTTANISDSSNKRFVTDAEKTVIDDTSGTNTGDQDLSGLVAKTTTVNGHALSSNVTVTKSDVSLGNVDNVEQLPLSYLDTSGTLSADSDVKVASQKATKTYVDAETSRAETAEATKQASLGYTPENVTNKATDFTTINNTLYPSVQAVNNAIVSAVTGLLNYRGTYDASGNAFPSSGGSGAAGVINKGDFWICSVAGTLGSTAVNPGDLIISMVLNPGQTDANWDLIEYDFGYTPVPSTRNLTINGTEYDLSADRSWTVTAAAPDLNQNNGTQSGNQTLSAGFSVVIVDEYIMNATDELVFSDPSEMAII